MSDIFKNVTAYDLDLAFKNQGRRVKRKTCNSNGTRYTMNRIKHGNASAENKGIDHRFKVNTRGKQLDARVYKDGEWVEVKLSKNARKKLARKGQRIEKVEKSSGQVTYFDDILAQRR